VKVGVIGVGAVGAATVLSLIERGGMCREIVVVDRTPERANGVATDMRYATRCHPRWRCAPATTTPSTTPSW
jgi:L-lactate dehydrogenase